ncbi:MAG: TolC family outer membrane protein [Hyphomicrobiales bacterium]|nr:TolC family outer membrane protein [Hyphomicrobiales bacterium]
MSFTAAASALLVSLAVSSGPARAAETLESALSKAYGSNPTLNAQRAALRVSNEGVSQALSGYRPRVTGTADFGVSYIENNRPLARATSIRQAPRGAGVQLDQTIWNAGRTSNAVSQAEALVLAGRETLRVAEQTVLLDAATAYMNVLRDTAILNLNNNNVEVLEEQLRQTRDRFNVGEVTRTDVAQSEARLASSRSQLSVAQANIKSSLGRYRQIVGVQPKRLAPGRPLERNLPRSLDEATRISQSQHPSIIAALHNVDAADIGVKVAEAELYPSLGLSASVAHRNEFNTLNDQRGTASALARLTVPIYEGGQVYSRTRQAKELAGQRRLEADITREQIRAAVVTAWGSLEASKAQTIAAQAQVLAAETALNGVREEAKVGQRTTLDVLNAQQELLSARSSLITAQRDRVVASYNVMSASGGLNARMLGLKVARHDPNLHYEQVRDKWIGTQTPDGR